MFLTDLDRSRRKFGLKMALAALGLLAGIPVLLVVLLLAYSIVKDKPAQIADFHPSQFEAKADSSFFYSIADDLKNSDEIDPSAPTLLRGRIDNFLVSPDKSKIAAVANGMLMVVSRDGSPARMVAAVSSIYMGMDGRQKKPIGKQFFRDQEFQWTPDSKELYLVKDQYYDSSGPELYSEKAELWKYSLDDGSLGLVLKPFPADSFFFGRDNTVYFSVPTAKGDLRLRYFDGKSVRGIGAVDAFSMQPWELARKDETPFFSFESYDYWQALQKAKRVGMAAQSQGPSLMLQVAGRSYLDLTPGTGLKGRYYCGNLQNSAYLPGDRYLLFDFSYCGNYDGQLLIDTATGKYEELPKNTRVYTTLNTETHRSYRISCGGILPN